jgi:hypothetical protein
MQNISPIKLHPNTPIKGFYETTVLNFWQWAYSDILDNRARSIFAEFLVGHALGVTENIRHEWLDADLLYNGKKIEVKTSAYIQSWHQNNLSQIKYDIASKRSWDPRTNTLGSDVSRKSDCYVFCLYTEKDKTKSDVLDTNKWLFYVLETQKINVKYKNQKSISLNRLEKEITPVKISELKKNLNKLLGLSAK